PTLVTLQASRHCSPAASTTHVPSENASARTFVNGSVSAATGAGGGLAGCLTGFAAFLACFAGFADFWGAALGFGAGFAVLPQWRPRTARSHRTSRRTTRDRRPRAWRAPPCRREAVAAHRSLRPQHRQPRPSHRAAATAALPCPCCTRRARSPTPTSLAHPQI